MSFKSKTKQFSDNFFTASPDSLNIYTALVQLAKKFGWKQMACVLGDDSSLISLEPDGVFTVEGDGLKLVFTFTNIISY